jgi:hypothetical protein
LPPLPRVNGAINVQPLRTFALQPGNGVPIVPELVELQMRLLYELGFEWIRITISFSRFSSDFLAAIPYVRAARALGINVLGLMADFSGYDLVQALVRRPTRDAVVGAYLAIFDQDVTPASPLIGEPGRFVIQVLNEPVHFLGIAPDVYVREYLSPVYGAIKSRHPELTVISAAEVGNVDGFLRFRTMLRTGLEQVCDGVGCHIYSQQLISLFGDLARVPVWVTESGVEGPENHLPWVRDVFPAIRRGISGVAQVFYFDLFDAQPRRFRLVDIEPRPDGGFGVAAESAELVQYYAARVAAAGGDVPHARYVDLIPDITAYFPNDADRAVIAATPFGTS